MKKLSLLLLVFINVMASFGQQDQTDNINFLHKPWQEVIEIAKQENKLIFVDCYTSWCGPCKMLAQKIFTQEKVADFFNANFINVKYDMEKGEGPNLVKVFNVKAYPTLLVYNGNGEEVHRRMGGGEADAILQFGQEAVDNTGTGGMIQRFKKGDRSNEFIEEYLQFLVNNGKDLAADEAVRTLLSEQPKYTWNSSENWKMIELYLMDIHSPVEAYIRENKNNFTAAVGEKAVNEKLKKMYSSHSMQLFEKNENGEVEINQDGFEQLKTLLFQRNITGKEEIIHSLIMRSTLYSKNWKEFAKLATKGLDYEYTPHEILNWASVVAAHCEDEAIRKVALKWVEHASQLSDDDIIQQWSHSLLEKL